MKYYNTRRNGIYFPPSPTSVHFGHSNDDEEVYTTNRSYKERNMISTPPQPKKRKEISMQVKSPTSVSSIAMLDSNMVSLSLLEDKSKAYEIPSNAIVSDPPSYLSSLAPESSPRSSRKRVHFKRKCTVRKTLSRKDMTPEERRRTWLTSKDYSRMHLRDEFTASMFEMGKQSIGMCARGLESKIEATALPKLSFRVTGSEEVLLEQERQWNSYMDQARDSDYFFYDFDSFHFVYGPVSEDALKQAQEIAQQDRLEAEKILASPTPFESKRIAVKETTEKKAVGLTRLSRRGSR